MEHRLLLSVLHFLVKKRHAKIKYKKIGMPKTKNNFITRGENLYRIKQRIVLRRIFIKVIKKYTTFFVFGIAIIRVLEYNIYRQKLGGYQYGIYVC